jgi:virginiamycin A acetyltransferase
VIGNDVWIAYGAMVLSGVTMGDGADCRSTQRRHKMVAGNRTRGVRKRFSEN